MGFDSHGGFLQMIFLLNWEIFFCWTSEIWGIYSRHFLLQARVSISSEPGHLKARRCAKETLGVFGWWWNKKPPHEGILRFLGENMVPDLTVFFFLGLVVGSMTFKGHFFWTIFHVNSDEDWRAELTEPWIGSWLENGKWFNLREIFGGFHKAWGNFGPHLRSANQGLRQWKRSIPSRNARQVGGGDGFKVYR